MKFLLSIAAVIAVAVAVPTQRGLVTPGAAGAAPIVIPGGAGPAPVVVPGPIAIGPAIIDSFEPIAVGPAIVDSFEPIAVGPAMVDAFEPISVGPAIVDFPLPEGAIVSPGPAVEAAANAPLVQIILNINQAAAEASPIVVAPPPVTPTLPTPVGVGAAEIHPTPVHVVDSAADAVQVVESAPVPVSPVQVAESAPVPVEPVAIGTPVLPSPAVVLPEDLN